MNNTLTALNGVRVGHSTHLDKLTGTTVVLFDKPLTVAYTGYGGAVGSFSTDALKSGNTNYKKHGIFISGGSNTGLMCGSNILDRLRKDGVGHKTGRDTPVYNPSITGAIIYDQGMNIAPFDPIYADEAYYNASTDSVKSGNYGAGTGASVGKFRWIVGGTKSGAMKAGVGSARVDLGNGIIVTAMSVVNAVGNVVLPNGEILAGNRDENTKFKQYKDLQDFLTKDMSNTTISIVGINVDLRSKEHYERVAHVASHGHVRAINPVHTSMDGDTVFVFSTDEIKDPLNDFSQYFIETDDSRYILTDLIGNAAAEAVQQSIYDACRSAETVELLSAWNGVLPSCNDYK